MSTLLDQYGEAIRKMPPMGEVAASGHNLFGKWNIMAYNPDELVRSKAKGLKIYQEMIREPYIKAALMQKKASLLSVPWDIQPASADKRDIEIAQFVRWNLGTHLSGSFNRDLFEVLDALDTGFSVNEKIWGIAKSGPYKGKIVYEKIKSKDPYYFKFNPDEFGNLGQKGLLLNSPAINKTNEPLQVDKFFIFSYGMRYENHYGTSDLRAAYRAYWIKDTAWKLRSVYMERFSGNNLKGKYPSGDDKAKNKLLEIFRTWQQETGIALPEGVDVEVLQIATSSVSEYERAIVDLNKEILVGILGETLTVDEGRKTGARNMGEIHKKVSDLFVLFLDITLLADINEQIVRQLVDYNYADVVNYPLFFFEPRESFDPEKYSRTLVNLQKLGAQIPASHVRKRFKLPMPHPGEEILVPVAAAKPETTPEEPKKFAEAPEPAKPANGYHRELSKFEKFAELPQVDLRLRRLTDTAKAASRPAYDDVFESVLAQVDDKKIIADGDYKAAARVVVNPSPLKGVVFRALLTANMMGRADVVVETQNQGFQFGRIGKFAEIDFEWSLADKPMTPKEAVAFFSGKVPMTRAEFDALTAALQEEAFFVTGLEKVYIEREVKALLADALKNGMKLEDFRFKLSELGVKYSAPVYGRVGTVGKSILDHHAELIFRNNLMSSYNSGKKALYDDPDVKEFFPAFEYSAIMDGRQTAICEGLDGKVYLADDPVWKAIWPPNHHNCRSTVVSVNKYDFTRDMLSDAPRLGPAEGFGG